MKMITMYFDDDNDSPWFWHLKKKIRRYHNLILIDKTEWQRAVFKKNNSRWLLIRDALRFEFSTTKVVFASNRPFIFTLNDIFNHWIIALSIVLYFLYFLFFFFFFNLRLLSGHYVFELFWCAIDIQCKAVTV